MPNDTPAFDHIGKRYDESFVERAAQVAEGDWLIEQLPRGSRVLDLGVGSGLPTAKQLIDAGMDVVGIDESAVMVALAEEQAPGGTYRLGDLRSFDGEYDAVVAFFSLLMLSKADIEATIQRAKRHLTGPRLLLISMVQGDFDAFPVNFLGAATTVSAYPPDKLRQVVTDAGFDVLEFQDLEAVAEPGRVEVQLFVRAKARD
ncbi:MAG: methyltransferase domain-containing protein [Actinomycetota bacterium]|nr:methyltransferase domain-containing protein [Actinomycetota bacterium]